MRARIRWASFKKSYWAWRNKLVKLPGGSLVVTSLVIEPYGEQLSGSVPADIFRPEQLGMWLQLPATEPGMKVSITFRNTSNYTFQVNCATMSSAFSTGRLGECYIISTGFESKANSEYTWEYTSQRLCRINELMIQLPKYVVIP